MLILDDILLFPLRGILWAFREVHNAARQEQENEAESITAELSELYMMLETGRTTEAEFDAREKELLDRLDEINEREIDLEEKEEDEKEGEDMEEDLEWERRRFYTTRA